MTYRERVTAPGPKRLLALEGGGIRNMVLDILARLEHELRRATRRPRLVLADVFDAIADTSTGAITATGLVLGFDVDHLRGGAHRVGDR